MRDRIDPASGVDRLVSVESPSSASIVKDKKVAPRITERPLCQQDVYRYPCASILPLGGMYESWASLRECGLGSRYSRERFRRFPCCSLEVAFGTNNYVPELIIYRRRRVKGGPATTSPPRHRTPRRARGAGPLRCGHAGGERQRRPDHPAAGDTLTGLTSPGGGSPRPAPRRRRRRAHPRGRCWWHRGWAAGLFGPRR